MLVLSSPSGAGKTSIARQLLADDANLTLSVSATTRLARSNEVDGRDYHFVNQERFDAMVAADEFLEYATVFDNSYGTPKADVMAVLEAGGDVLFDIDWQGTQQVANAAGDDRDDDVDEDEHALARGHRVGDGGHVAARGLRGLCERGSHLEKVLPWVHMDVNKLTLL